MSHNALCYTSPLKSWCSQASWMSVVLLWLCIAHKVTSTNARLDFELQTQADVHRQYRALGELVNISFFVVHFGSCCGSVAKPYHHPSRNFMWCPHCHLTVGSERGVNSPDVPLHTCITSNWSYFSFPFKFSFLFSRCCGPICLWHGMN